MAKINNCTELLSPEACSANLMAVGDALYAIGGKWKLRIIVALKTGSKRFNELQRSIEGISAKALAAELKENGVTANIIQVRSIDVEHTGKGTTPEEILGAMLYLFSEEASKVNGARIPLY